MQLSHAPRTTMMDFTATYVVVGDVATAATLPAFGFVLGPFVYFGREKAWKYCDSRRRQASHGTTG